MSLEDKTETKMGVHQILTKNGFYRLPMHSLTEILKLLEMPESLEPKTIQENAINGILKIVEKNNSKFSEYVLSSKASGVSKETKEYVNVILNDSFNFLTKKSVYQPPQPPPMYPGQMGSTMPGYPPMNQYSFMRPPPMPGMPEPGSDADNLKMLDQQMRMQQQMYMYYYGMYGLNPMFNPGFMNHYGAYGQMPGKPTNSPSNSMPPMGMPMPPMPPMGPMGPMPPMPIGNGFNQKLSTTNRLEEAPTTNQRSSKQTPVKQVQPTKPERGKGKNDQSNKLQKTPILKSEEKKKVDKNKLAVQNPPFIVNESTGNKKVKEEKIPKTVITNELLRYCACKGTQKYEDQFLCSICNRTFHYRCLNESIKKTDNKEPIECYHCRLRFIDPLNRVKEVIAEHYIPNINDNKFWMTCNLKPYEYLCRPKGGKNEIEMRCLKVSAGEVNEITWPDECIIKLNGERIIEIPALQINSSLKKRKDYSIIITQNIYNKSNEADSQALEKVRLSLEIRTLTKQQISHRKIKNNFTFAFAIYFVERLTVDQLYQKIIIEEKVPESPDYLQKLMKTTSNDIEIDKIVINLYDPFTWDVIKTPVRGFKCVHGQCFDLKTFISFMSTARNRTWKCPVCGKDARKFMVDSQQSQLIKRVQDTNSVPSEITFMRDGTIVLKVDNQSDEDELVSSSRPEKTKKIHKEHREDRNQKESESKKQEASEKDNTLKDNHHEDAIEQQRKPTEIVELDENDEMDNNNEKVDNANVMVDEQVEK